MQFGFPHQPTHDHRTFKFFTMYTPIEKQPVLEHKAPIQHKNTSPYPVIDERPEAQRMEALQRLAATRARPEDQKIAQLQALAVTHTPAQRFPIQRNDTGIPDRLKTGMEQLTGMSLDHVKVHYNSSKPAAVQAHAYAQGNQIHLASGQEKHLPHELGHVVQQAQGRVKPTTEVNGMKVNDSPALEKEADVMGAKALTFSS
jgi:hypothetical protein